MSEVVAAVLFALGIGLLIFSFAYEPAVPFVPQCDAYAPPHFEADVYDDSQATKTGNLMVERGWKNVTVRTTGFTLKRASATGDCPFSQVAP